MVTKGRKRSQKHDRHSWFYQMIKCGQIILGLFLGVFLSASVPAQAEKENASVDPSGVGASYSAVLYDSSTGLPTSEANTVLQTADGFIWIGSYSGLIRYEGNSFYRYDSTEGISNVISLYEDSKSRLWIGTNDNGVAKYEDGIFTFYGKVEGLKSSSIRSIVEDEDGNILIATTLGIAYIDKNQELHVLDEPQLDGEYVCELHRGSDGIVYGETISGAFFTLKKKRVTSFFNGPALGFGSVNCIYPDMEHPGYVYLGTEQSEIIYVDMNSTMQKYDVYHVSPLMNINAINVINGIVWLCSDNGIGFIREEFSEDTDGGYHLTFGNEYTELKNIPMNNSVDGVLGDYEGNLWFVSSRQGVMKIAPSQFTNLSLAAGLENMVVNTTCLCDGKLYAGTDTGLVVLDEDHKPVKTPLTKLLKGSRIRCIKRDLRGNLWFCTYSEFGLLCYHKDGTYEVFNEKNGLASNRVRTVLELSDGRMLVSCSGGVYIIEGGKITEHYGTESGLSNTEILCMVEGADGVLYLGSDGDGLYRIDGKNVVRYGLDDNLSSEVILRIKKDAKRKIFWIITSNSIAYMKDEKITTVTNFPYSNNFDVFFDTSDRAWVLSSNGIYIVSIETLLSNPKKPEYIFYDTKCGLPCVATANSRSAKAPDGTLYIAGTTGISSINIDKADDVKTESIKLAVPFVEIDGKMTVVKPGKTLYLPSGCKRLVIYDYALTYSLKNPKVRYSFEGFEDKAITISKQDMEPVTYTNLSGGRYRFLLSVVDTLSGKVSDTLAVEIVKKKALYEYIWFWVIVVLAFLGITMLIVIIYFRRKTAALLREQEEKQVYIDQISHAFAKCIDLKDTYTRGHSFRVATFSRLLAEKMGYTESEVHDVYNIALLHDIGKISIPDEILGKPGKPTDEEYEILKQHAKKGYEILKDISIAPNLAIGAGFHHERLDGKGYPNGVTEQDIPIVAQIIAVADTFDAMYSTRPYRKQLPLDVVIEELKRVSGTQLNAEIVTYLSELVEEGKIGNKEELHHKSAATE